MNVHEHFTGAQAYTIDRWNKGVTDTPYLYQHLDPFKVTDEAPKDAWYAVSETTTGDYSGYGCIGASNRDVLERILEAAPSVDEDQWAIVSGHHSSCCLFLRGDLVCEDVLDSLASLTDYCILDSDDASERESDAQNDAWEQTYREEFHQALINNFSCLDLSTLTDSELDALFYDNEPEWYSEYDAMCVDVDVIADGCVTYEALIELFDTWTPTRKDEG